MEREITYQKVRKGYSDKLEMAVKYYNVISVLNELSLTEKELKLIAYIVLRGNVFNVETKKRFCEEYDTSLATINNMVSRLKKVGVLIRENNSVKVRPLLVLNFENNIVIQLWMQRI